MTCPKCGGDMKEVGRGYYRCKRCGYTMNVFSARRAR